ncbi:MAG TPA: acyl-CoA thioesterase [Anaerolineae bacterium]
MAHRPREVTLRFLAGLGDMNIMGNVHGGAVMKWIDEAGYACAAGWCGLPSVTVYVGGIRFYKPVPVGNLVEINAKLIYTGHTSMHIAVDVCSADPKAGQYTPTTHCIIVFVALDEHGRPTPVPAWEPESANDIALQQYARRIMELRKGIEEEMIGYGSNGAPQTA